MFAVDQHRITGLSLPVCTTCWKLCLFFFVSPRRGWKLSRKRLSLHRPNSVQKKMNLQLFTSLFFQIKPGNHLFFSLLRAKMLLEAPGSHTREMAAAKIKEPSRTSETCHIVTIAPRQLQRLNLDESSPRDNGTHKVSIILLLFSF